MIHSFQISHEILFEYRPLAVVLFGGSKGAHLKKLIGITVWVAEEYVYGIDFIYNTDADGRTVHTLGRTGPFHEKRHQRDATYKTGIDVKHDFPIDGPGSEQIAGVQIQIGPDKDMQGLRVSFTVFPYTCYVPIYEPYTQVCFVLILTGMF